MLGAAGHPCSSCTFAKSDDVWASRGASGGLASLGFRADHGLLGTF